MIKKWEEHINSTTDRRDLIQFNATRAIEQIEELCEIIKYAERNIKQMIVIYEAISQHSLADTQWTDWSQVDQSITENGKNLIIFTLNRDKHISDVLNSLLPFYRDELTDFINKFVSSLSKQNIWKNENFFSSQDDNPSSYYFTIKKSLFLHIPP